MTTKRTNTDILKGLVAAGMRMHYGDKPEREVKLRFLWEVKHIIDAGFVDYYVMAFWIFRHMAQSMEIGVWGRGAMPSSIVCYSLGLTEVDPVKYDLHSVRFVNNELPKFQFDVEASRFDEFMKGAEDLLQTSAAEGYDIRAIRQCLFCNIMRASYLSKEKQRSLPEDMDDELARYALYFPQTMDLYDVYVQNPKSNILIYQEQMLDILKETFHVPSIKTNLIRLSIQRGETEQVEAFKKEAFDASDLPDEEKEKAWQRLISNSRAFLKAHAVSRVLSSYKYEIK